MKNTISVSALTAMTKSRSANIILADGLLTEKNRLNPNTSVCLRPKQKAENTRKKPQYPKIPRLS